MKKLLLLLLVLFIETANAQLVSISPNHGLRGQTLNTTITAANGVISMSSGPLNLNDIYLKQGTQMIYATNYSFIPPFPPHTDSMNVVFDIPLSATTGFYDVHIITWVNIPFPTSIDNVLTNGFSIGEALIEGDIYFDVNQNGIHDAGETGMANNHVVINPSGTTSLTNLNGHYKIRVDSGSYTVNSTFPGNFVLTSSPANYLLAVPPDTSGNDFGLYTPPSTSIKQNFSIITYPLRCSRPGYSGWFVTSNSNNIQNGIVTIIHSSNLTFVSSSITPSSINGDTLRWIYQLQPFASLSSDILYMVPGMGSIVGYTAIDSVFDQFGNFSLTQTESYLQTVLCSHDPNEKIVSPAGVDSLHYTLKNADLTYTIRFQNTGSDTAYNVIILDTLDSNLDYNTLELLSSSNPVSIQMDVNGVVRFTFDNILLPDSSVDELRSNGFVTYRIHPITTVPNYTPVFNTSYIYFDFNAAVVTNTTMNTLVTQIPVNIVDITESQESFVFPNPVSDASVLTVPSSLSFDLRIFDATGREVLRKNISTDFRLVKNKFSPGIYHYRLIGKDGAAVYIGKFVVTE